MMRGLGQEHVLHDDEALRERERIDVVAADRIRADDVKRFELAGLGCVDHLGMFRPGAAGIAPHSS